MKHLKCPTCDIALVITDRQGIEVDYCERCRGVWLDRGELDKIIARGAALDNDNGDVRLQNGRRRERENPIADIFDFF